MGNAIKELFSILDQSQILGVIDLVDETLGKVGVRYLSMQGRQTLNMPNPWFGGTAWLRAYPTEGSFVLVSKTQVDQEAHIIKVFDQSEQARLLLNFAKGISSDPAKQAQGYLPPVDNIAEAQAPPEGFPFRKLRGGELETVSSGRAEWWFSSTGTQVGRSGLVRQVQDARRLTTSTLAAAHTLQGLDHSQVADVDLIHFGVVRRALDINVIAAQKLLNASLISQELEALVRDNTDQKAAWKVLDEEVKTSRSVYEGSTLKVQKLAQKLKGAVKLPESYDQLEQLQEPIREALQSIQVYKLLLEKLEVFGTSLGYSQPDFSAAVKDIRSQRVEVEALEVELKTSLPAKNLNQLAKLLADLENQGPKEVPNLNLDKTLQGALQNIDSQKKQLEVTTEALLKASQVQKEEVEERHVYKTLLLEQNQFCKEHRISVFWKGQPNHLYEVAHGHVYDSDGVREKSPTTQLPLRSREAFVGDSGKATVIFVDVNGNVSHILSPSATDGYTLVVPRGNGRMHLGESLDVTVGKSATIHIADHLSIQVEKLMEVEAEDIKWTARKSMEFNAKVVKINADVATNITSPTIQLNGITTALPTLIHN